MTNFFTRTLELANCELEIFQQQEGDVGCVVWDAAITLAKYIDLQDLKSSINLQDKDVIELGAGTGIVGLVAATHGAKVTLTDLPEFIPLIQKNITHNTKHWESQNVNAIQLKWREDLKNFTKTFDVILMADLIYYEESIEPLVETMVALSGKETIILMSYEERTTGNKPELQGYFFKLAEKHFAMRKVPLEEQDPIYRSDDIHIYQMQLK